MKKVKISHEVPFCLLEKSKEFNDYDYCLPHLMDQNEEYKNFFYESKKQGRYIVMDNSLHELGEAYNTERLMHWIEEIKPDEFIVPDVWENCEESIQNATIWDLYDFPKGVEKVAVVQAKSIHEASLCVKAYKDLGYGKICFSYGASYYNDICTHPNKDLGKALGRLMVISTLLKTGELKQDDRIHLLGCAVPQEFGWYSGINCIESIDTSNPVMAALEGIKYEESGLNYKPKANMNGYFYMLNDKIDYSILTHNLEKFKTINNL